MFTAFCALGGGFEAGRIPAVRTTVVAPTVAAYTGIPTPPDAVGESVLSWMQDGDPLARKIGALLDQVRDSITVSSSSWKGIFFLGRAPYLLVILTEGFTEDAVGSPLMAEISRRVWRVVTGEV
jgi:hypothetical protein